MRMSKKVRTWVAGLTVLAVAALAWQAGPGTAGDGKGFEGDVMKIAAAFKKGDADGAKKMAEGVAKKVEDIAEVMEGFKTKKKGGWSPFPKESDGIELKLREVARDGLKTLGNEAGAWEQSGYISAAIAAVAHARPQGKESGKQLKKEWLKWSEEMQQQGLDLAKAAKGGSAAEVKTAATKLNATCNACHAPFRQ
jgi:hypothetical protein